MARQALGRGIEALLPPDEEPRGDLLQLALGSIDTNPDQPRKNFDEAALTELADSIRAHGILQPILVAPGNPGRYLLIAGERRFRAAKMAGLDKLPALLVRINAPQGGAVLALVENLQREDLNPLEEALGYRHLADSYEWTQEEIASKVGKDRTTVTNALRLLRLPEPVLKLVADRRLSAGHARAILGLPTEGDQTALARTVVENGLSVRGTETMVARLLARTSTSRGKAGNKSAKSDSVLALEQLYSRHLGLPVTITTSRGKGTMTIRWNSLDAFDRLRAQLGLPEPEE